MARKSLTNWQKAVQMAFKDKSIRGSKSFRNPAFVKKAKEYRRSLDSGKIHARKSKHSMKRSKRLGRRQSFGRRRSSPRRY